MVVWCRPCDASDRWILIVRCLRDEQAFVRLRSGKSAYV
jgi:hypothetical protein